MEIRLAPEDIERLKQYATKMIEGEELILIVGKNWLVMTRKLHEYEHEYVEIRCFGNICEPYKEIEIAEILDEALTPTTVEVKCIKEREVGKDIEDFECEVRYNYIVYDATIAITIDPLDINRLDNDKELQLLLDLMRTNRILIRPM
jgi:hypothetical protein